MAEYNPTNTRASMMSYLDAGAPQCNLTDREGMFTLLDTLLTSGYNTQSIDSLVATGSLGSAVLTVNYSAPHGYQLGHLLEISGANEGVYNTLWRVDEIVDTLTLKLKVIDQGITYTTATGTLISKVAPLDWEIVYTSSSQRSYRSKMVNSSKNVLTLRKPRHIDRQQSNSCVIYEVEVSADMNASTGVSINSYTSDADYINQASNNNNPYGAFYLPQSSTSSTSLSNTIIEANTSRLPWYLVGDGRLFYFVSGWYVNISNPSEDSSYLNYNRLHQATSRYLFQFGDPNAFNENDILNGNGTMFSPFHVNTSFSYAFSTPSIPDQFSSYRSAASFFVRKYDGSPYRSWALPLTIGGYLTNSTDNDFGDYPNMATNGFIFFPYYVKSDDSNPKDILRATMPYVVFSPLDFSSAFTSMQFADFDYMKTKNDDGSITMFVCNSHTNKRYTYCFNLGV